MNPAQLKAALGLPLTAEDSFYLQQQQQTQQQQLASTQQHQHELHLRRLQLQEQQLRARSDQLHEYPDIQQRLHRTMLINEQLAAQQLGLPSQLQQQQHHAAFLREQHVKQQLQAEEQLLLRRHQQHQQHIGNNFHLDEMVQPTTGQLDGSQQFLPQKQQPTSPGRLGSPHFESVHALDTSSAGLSKAAFDDVPNGDHSSQQNELQIHQQREEQVKAFLSSYHIQNNETMMKQAIEHQQQQADLQNNVIRGVNGSPSFQLTQAQEKPSTPTSKKSKSKRTRERETKGLDETKDSPISQDAKKIKKKRRTKVEILAAKEAGMSSRDSKGTKVSKKLKAPHRLLPQNVATDDTVEMQSFLPSLPFLNDAKPESIVRDFSNVNCKNEMDHSARSGQSVGTIASQRNGTDAKDMEIESVENIEIVDTSIDSVIPHEDTHHDLHQLGSLTDLLQVADEFNMVDEAANILVFNVGNAEVMSESELDSDDENYVPPARPYGLPPRRDLKADIPLPLDSTEPTFTFKCRLPQLPEEPVFAHDITDESDSGKDLLEGESSHKDRRKQKHSDKPTNEDLLGKGSSNHSKSKGKKSPTSLEYPYPIDTWWPSVSGMKKELRNAGETSDEDNFEETPSQNGEHTCFRANEPKIRRRLSNSVEPGVLEKLPHCKIHRVRTKRKKNSTAPELVYCTQVTELYPNDIMVNCSKCGTWRHAACGGHYMPYSNRQNTVKPFVAICDFCTEEEPLLREYPIGERRLERQRMEHLRRGLATSAVMRHASFSKHGGTYKWPLGSVSATHIGGHTRSVHVRHDKAEKQWTDMTSRLGRGYGYRQKERVRSRTKEFERLLVSIEDAESYTDRHNMIVFLQRDTAKEKPTGLEDHVVNIFDPADDDLVEQAPGATTELNSVPVVEVVNTNAEEVRDTEDNYDELRKQLYEDSKLVSESENQESEGMELNVASTNSTRRTCVRVGCRNRRRFDSQFCSDACGVSVLEQDLLQTLQEAGEIHPSILRV
jgi:hypothetical protein